MDQTARHALRDAAARLEAAGIAAADARVDADVLLRHVLGWDRATLLLRRDEPLRRQDADAFSTLVTRRLDRVPVAYLTGVREFYGRPFQVTPAVLIPRPESELLVDLVLQHADDGARRRVADVCTGSGMLAITLACERPGCRVVGTDVSRAALQVARGNVQDHVVAPRVVLVECDLLSAVGEGLDVIVANPPYVPASEADTLAPEVAVHEPGLALFGGDDGLAVIRRLLPEARRCLRPGGRFLMEFGAGQRYDVVHLAAQAGLDVTDVVADLQGIPRVLCCRRPPLS